MLRKFIAAFTACLVLASTGMFDDPVEAHGNHVRYCCVTNVWGIRMAKFLHVQYVAGGQVYVWWWHRI